MIQNVEKLVQFERAAGACKKTCAICSSVMNLAGDIQHVGFVNRTENTQLSVLNIFDIRLRNLDSTDSISDPVGSRSGQCLVIDQ